jgi:hypothetical protein
VAESWFALAAEDQKEALAVAAAESGWPAFLLEKDIWVVWALQILGTDQQLLQSLTFKGGISLSKAHGLIERFSEDVDLTVNIQHLWPDVDLAPAVNPSQAERRRKAADSKLKQWVSEIPTLLQGAVSAAGIPVKLTRKAAEPRRRQPPTIVLHYPPLIPAPEGTYGFVRPTVLLEFGCPFHRRTAWAGAHHLRGSDPPGHARFPDCQATGDGPEAHVPGEGRGDPCLLPERPLGQR